MHVALYVHGTRNDPAVRRNVLAIAPTFVLAPAALFALPWLPEGWRLPYLFVALLIDASSPYVSGVAELPVKPAHFAERFALFVIITLGESIVSIGSGAGAHPHGAVLLAVRAGVRAHGARSGGRTSTSSRLRPNGDSAGPAVRSARPLPATPTPTSTT